MTLRTAVITCVIAIGYSGLIGLSQGIVAQPELIAGAWEMSSVSGIDGIHLDVRTHAKGTASSTISSQTISMRIYHRRDGKETWGWYRVP
jgi:hypothetical protein